MKYKDITHKIIGCAIKVHTTQGKGFNPFQMRRQACLTIDGDTLPSAKWVGSPLQGVGVRREINTEKRFSGGDLSMGFIHRNGKARIRL